MRSNVTIKLLKTLEEVRDMEKLERDVWKMDPIPNHQTLTAAKNGGILLGAYAGDEIVGFNYGFPGFRSPNVYLCSHMTGVYPNYQKRGLGRLLKEKQHETALEYGYSLITWTFDPLESLNANLNLLQIMLTRTNNGLRK
jgi:predicted GNAT superfamily acetyltransferase